MKTVFVPIVLLALAACHGAQTHRVAQSTPAAPQIEPTYRISDAGVTAPKVATKVDPEYTDAARQEKIAGTTALLVVIDPEGRAQDIQVTRSLDPGLDQKAIDAVRQWTFVPGLKDGKAVRVFANIEINFRLL